MTSMAVVTPSWRPDLPLFDQLHRSVLEFTPPETVHHVIVPWLHRRAFERYQGQRCRVWTHPELLPRRYVRMPGGIWVNALRPWPPVRGWVMQQAAKIAGAAMADSDVVLLMDSDVVLVRPVEANRFTDGCHLRFYRDRAVIDAGMPRHVLWHQVARELLGLPTGPPPPLDDYVTPVGIWEPKKVRAMQRRIEHVTGQHWQDAFTSRLHVSEFILYGVFMDEMLSEYAATLTEDTTLCHNSWLRDPLDEKSARAFAEEIDERSVAIMISSHSSTPAAVRRIAARRCAELSER